MADFKSLRARLAGREPDATDAELQGRTEALGNGLALGAGSRLGAAMQAGMAGLTGGDGSDTYNQALRENRELLAREHAAEPARALALEAAGGIPSAVVATAGQAPRALSFANR